MMMIIIPAAIVAAISVLYLAVRQGRKRGTKANIMMRPEGSADRECMLLALEPCRTIIDGALSSLTSHDAIAACRNHRTGAAKLLTVSRQIGKVMAGNVYNEYMLEAAERVADSTRRIVTNAGDTRVSVTSKCEIDIIREGLNKLMQSADTQLRSNGNLEGVKGAVDSEKDFIEHTIAEHAKSMRHEEFDDGSPAYFYLMLLYNLHSFVSSFGQVMKQIEGQNARQMIA